MKTYFTYLSGQGIVTHAKQYTDNCLFDITTVDTVELEADDDDMKDAAKNRGFPESSDELMQAYESQYLELRPDSKIKSGLACVLFMAKLETLAQTEAPADDDKEQEPVMFKALCVDVSSRTIGCLSRLIERFSKTYYGECRVRDDDYVPEIYMLLAALRILRVHLHQAVRSKMSLRELGMETTAAEHLRRLVVRLFARDPRRTQGHAPGHCATGR